MGLIKDDTGKLTITDGAEVTPYNRWIIELLNTDRFFTTPSMNHWGRELALYLANNAYQQGAYGSIQNPEPADLRKNTMQKVLNRLRVIDNHIGKPLEQYTSEDLNRFIADFLNGNVKHPKGMTNKDFEPTAIKGYVTEFRRLWRIYRLNAMQTTIDLRVFEWGLHLKAPKTHRASREKYPWLSLDQVLRLVESLPREEYRVRTLLAVNLMGRKCEISNLKKQDIEIRGENEIWVQLPEIKKSGSEKVPVELFSFVKKPLIAYLDGNNFEPGDLLFPSKEPAYAKALRLRSEELFKSRITPKTLRKLGVCIAEQLGYLRGDIERIGGWRANSNVLDHYLSRHGVAVKKDKDFLIDQQLNKSLYEELEQERVARKKLESQLDRQRREIDEQMAAIRETFAAEIERYSQIVIAKIAK